MAKSNTLKDRLPSCPPLVVYYQERILQKWMIVSSPLATVLGDQGGTTGGIYLRPGIS